MTRVTLRPTHDRARARPPRHSHPLQYSIASLPVGLVVPRPALRSGPLTYSYLYVGPL